MRPLPTLCAVIVGAVLLAWVTAAAVAPRTVATPGLAPTGGADHVGLASLPPVAPGSVGLPPLPPPNAGLPPPPPAGAGQALPPGPAPATTVAPILPAPAPTTTAKPLSSMDEATRPMLDPTGADPLPSR